MIEDEELRSLFKAEGEEHLQQLEEKLLQLEQGPADSELLKAVFREAHSLKGAARMLGVRSVESLAHRFEDLLGAAKRGKLVLAPEIIDRLYRALDALRKCCHEALTGEPSDVNVPAILEELQVGASSHGAAEKADRHEQRSQVRAGEATPQPAQPVKNEPPPVVSVPTERPVLSITTPTPASIDPPAQRLDPEPADETATAAKLEEPALATAQKDDGESSTPDEEGKSQYRIETIRVKPQQLDSLMTLAGELTVTKVRMNRREEQIEELLLLWGEWAREVAARKLLLSKIERSSQNGTVTLLANSYEKERERLEHIGMLLGRMKSANYEDQSRLDFVSGGLSEGIQKIRLLPLSTILSLFPRMVRDLALEQSKEVQLVIEGGETTADKRIIEEMKDPLMHLIRNAIDHGIEHPEVREKQGKPRMATIRLKAYQTSTNIMIEVADDGRGLDPDAIMRTAVKRSLCHQEELATMKTAQIHTLIFSSGFSTSPIVTDVSGRGVGLDVVRSNVEHLKGTIQVKSTRGQGCLFHIQFPSTVATARVLIVQAAGHIYALPVESVQTTCLVSRTEIFSIEGKETIALHHQPVSVAKLADLLEFRGSDAAGVAELEPHANGNECRWPCVVLSIGDESIGLFVDSLLDEREIVLKPMGAVLQRVRNVSGATILGSGEVCMVLNPLDLIKSVRKQRGHVVQAGPVDEAAQRKTVLLVEDSMTTRTQEKRILEAAGYEVVTAVDGADAWTHLISRNFDVVVSDIEMPNINGLTLTEKIRKDTKYSELPVILVTSLASEEDKQRGVEVGANAYITKPSFDQKALLDTLRRFA